MDEITGNEGSIRKMQEFQASCPRDHIKALWWVVIPMGFAILGMGLKFLASVGKGA